MRHLIAIALLLACVACDAPPPRPKPRYVVKHYIQGLGEYSVAYEAAEVRTDGQCVKLYDEGDDGAHPRRILCGKVAVERVGP